MRRLAAVGAIAVLGALGAVGVVGAGTASASTTAPQGTATRAAAAYVAAAPRAAATKAPPPLVESVSPQGLGGLVSWAPDPASAAVTQYSAEAIPAPGTTPPPNCSTPVVVSVPGSNTAAVVGGLCTGVAYVARVRAVNVAGAGAWSATSTYGTPYEPRNFNR